jgi:hypothetical protein
MVTSPMKALVQSLSRTRVGKHKEAGDDVAVPGTSSISTWVLHWTNFNFIAICARMILMTGQLAGNNDSMSGGYRRVQAGCV